MAKRWITLKPDEKRPIDEPCPCCGGQAFMRSVNMMTTLACDVCGLKVTRGVINEQTQAKCEQECLKVWKKRVFPAVRPARLKFPAWVTHVAQDFHGEWHGYDHYPKLDSTISGWSCGQSGRSIYLQVKGDWNPMWWKTVYHVRDL